MPTTTEALLSEFIHRKYDKKRGIMKGVWTENRTLKLIPTKKIDELGERIENKIRIAEAQGVGGRNAMEPLPRSRAAQLLTSYFSKRRLYFTASWDAALEILVGGGSGSWVNAVDDQMASVRRTFKFHMGRMIQGDGLGILARLNGAAAAVAAGSDVTVDLDNWATVGCTVWLQKGAQVGVAVEGGGTIGGVTPMEVAGTTYSTNAVQFTTALTAPDNAVIVLADDQGHSYDKEYHGLQTLIGTGDVQGVTVANYPAFKSDVKAVNGPYNHHEIIELVMGCLDGDDDDDEFKGVGDINVVWHTARSVEHARANEGATLFEPMNLDFRRGVKTPTIQIGSQTVNLVHSRFWNPTEITAWKKGLIARAVIDEEHWDTNGGGLVKQMPYIDGHYSFGREIGEFILDGHRRNSGRRTGVEIDTQLLNSIMSRR